MNARVVGWGFIFKVRFIAMTMVFEIPCQHSQLVYDCCGYYVSSLHSGGKIFLSSWNTIEWVLKKLGVHLCVYNMPGKHGCGQTTCFWIIPMFLLKNTASKLCYWKSSCIMHKYFGWVFIVEPWQCSIYL